MSEQVARSIIKGVLYEYDSKHHWINGRERADPTSSAMLDLIDALEYLKAQLLLFGLIEPDGKRMTKPKMRDALLQFVASPAATAFMNNEKQFFRPRVEFSVLEHNWDVSYGSSFRISSKTPEHESVVHRGQTPTATRKRNHDSIETQQDSASKRSKAGHPAGLVLSGNEDAELLRDGNFRQPASQDQVIKAEDSSVAYGGPLATTRARESHRKLIEKYKLRDYHRRIIGAYAISCPLIEERYPGLEEKLRLDSKVFREPGSKTTQDTELQGVAMGHLDLGLLKGTVAMGTDDRVLADWCYRRHLGRDSFWTPNDTWSTETRRIWTAVSEAYDKIDGFTAADLQQPDCPTLLAPVDLARPATYFLEARFTDEKQLFMKPDLIFGTDGHLTFTDLQGLEFAGELHMPMLSPDPVTFTGYKISSKAQTTIGSWGSHDMSKIRYGDAWNKSG